jgi:general secretion pathway protein D
VALGGLVSEEDSEVESKVPLLGDIPILGFFFKKKQTQKSRTEAIFLLTPHIIMAPEETGEVSGRVMEGMEHPYIKEGNRKLFEFDRDKRKLKRTTPTVPATDRTEETGT